MSAVKNSIGSLTHGIELEIDAAGSLYVPLLVNGVSVMALVDSGSTVSVIHPSVLGRSRGGREVTLERGPENILLADGSCVATIGCSPVTVEIGDADLACCHSMVVAAIDAPVVVLDFLRAHKCILDLEHNILLVGNKEQQGHVPDAMPKMFKICTTESVFIPPMTEMIISGRIEGDAHFTAGLVTQRDRPLCDGNVAMAKSVVNMARVQVPLRVMNMSQEPQLLFKGMNVAQCEQVVGVDSFEEVKTPEETKSDKDAYDG